MSASRPQIQEALLRLDELTRRLRRDCPWDREQDERTIVPHTVEEAYELADAANRRDDAKLLDELGDVLFQVHFLALLLEERGAGDLAAVAEHCRQKLIRRHPHVFSDVEVEDAAHVLRNWDEIKKGEPGREQGIFGEVPDNLPALLYARKVQRRAASSGFDFPGVEGPLQSVRDELEELEAAIAAGGDTAGSTAQATGDDGSAAQAAAADTGHAGDDADALRDARFHELGDVLFAAVNVARKLKLDPELALRAASDRFRGRVESAAELAARAGRAWDDLTPDEQLTYYARARLAAEAPAPPPATSTSGAASTRPGEPDE